MTKAPKISDSDYERLQDHVRLLHGLKLRADAPRHKTFISRRRKSAGHCHHATKPTTTMSPCMAAVAAAAAAAGIDLTTPSTDDAYLPAFEPRLNKAHYFRRECTQRRIGSRMQMGTRDVREAQRIRDQNQQPKQSEYFRLNHAFHMRWKKIRGLPVVHSHFRDTYLQTGKPPFVVPVHYEPFNVYWDADYAKQEFIFLDAASEEKKKDEKKKEKKSPAKPEPPLEPSTQTPSGSSSERRESSSTGKQPSPGQPPPKQQPPSGQQSPSGQQAPSGQQSPSGQQAPSRQEPPLEQQQPRRSSSVKKERQDRQSTGYEGFPRDSEIERAQYQSP